MDIDDLDKYEKYLIKIEKEDIKKERKKKKEEVQKNKNFIKANEIYLEEDFAEDGSSFKASEQPSKTRLREERKPKQ